MDRFPRIAELFEVLRGSDETAARAARDEFCEIIVGLLRPRGHAIGRGMGLSRQVYSTSDLLQSVQIKILEGKALPSWLNTEGEFRAFFNQVCRTKAIAKLRESNRRKTHAASQYEDFDIGAWAAEQWLTDPFITKLGMSREEFVAIVDDWLAASDDPAVTAVYAKIFDGKTWDEVAAVLEVTHDRARALYKRGLRQIRRKFASSHSATA